MADIESLIQKVQSYNPEADVDLIRRAFDYAYEAHKDQIRISGEPYITHPLATAEILADLEMDNVSIAAALLHDVVEDQDFSIDDIRKNFGDEIAGLVDGVTKLALADFDVGEENLEEPEDAPKKKKTAEFRRSAENLRKIFLAMARDLRVMVIKLADRLHNMSTLDNVSREQQIKVSRETKQIYCPLAHRLGIWKIKWELEDYAFKYLEPEAYADISDKVNRHRNDREEELAEAVDMMQRHLAKDGIEAHIQARQKHLWSIYQKIKREEVEFSEIYDLSAIRVIVNRVGDCYHALGLVHDLWMPIPERFSDYIAKPKSNMYQSLHTKVIGPRGEPLEVQIRTWDMHRVADFGVAAHWQYKERVHGGDEFERKLSWLRQQLFDWQSDSIDAGEFLHSVINDLFTDQVFVFTPRGDVIDLPAGSTPVDFAYRIHSDVGNKCVGAKVNGRIVQLTYKFNNGDIVEIISRSNSQPSRDWLSFVKTSHAKNRIKSYYRKLYFGDSVIKGRDMLERELERIGQDAHHLKTADLNSVAKQLNLHNEEDLLAAVGYGHVTPLTVINKLKLPTFPKAEAIVIEAPKSTTGKKGLAVTLDGVKNLMISRAKCCAPLPGEDVVGYISRGKGVVLHSAACPNAAVFKLHEPERLIEINWVEAAGDSYSTDIKIKAMDRLGLLNDITAVFSESKINITGAKIKSLTDKTANIDLTVDVTDIRALNDVITKLNSISDVLVIDRVSGHMSSKVR
ncbi:MAG: bifunctional (p)ppGpp synthetase/guanosine-3',5'-bis(diphosphate) 3'-pyrophosphohydrolase [Armatimonadetes bacterium]|nr:bifunctional (p)ppGpp synthetase/guanosine-3',5'-bis(diphosphate) 3'-pyrophosphohydrolase [Armatimonadota bacterium]